MPLYIDDHMDENKKVEELTDREFRVHFNAMCWSARERTDGHITRGRLTRLGGSPALARALVSKGVWDENGDGGWVIHDWLEYNPPADPEERRRWFAKRRQQGWRERHKEGEDA